MPRKDKTRCCGTPLASTDGVVYGAIHLDYTATVPPVYTIDLSLPPEQRYVQVARDFKHQLQELLSWLENRLSKHKILKRLLHTASAALFRKVYSSEQQAELCGIAEASDLPIHFLVAANIFAETIAGCTSGGFLLAEEGSNRMIHYRTMDIRGEILRNLIVQFEYKASPDGEVIARAVSYAGLVVILTGVRKGLSVSLNERYPFQNNRPSPIQFVRDVFGVVLGRRPGTGTLLRDLLLPRTEVVSSPPEANNGDVCKQITILERPSQTLDDIVRDFRAIRTRGAYLVFCDGTRTVVLEKSRSTAEIFESTTFLSVSNTDASYYEELEQERSDFRDENPDASETLLEAASYNTEHFEHRFPFEFVKHYCDGTDYLDTAWEKWTDDPANYDADGNIKGWSMSQWRDRMIKVFQPDTQFAALMNPLKGEFRWVYKFDLTGVNVGDAQDAAEGPTFLVYAAQAPKLVVRQQLRVRFPREG